MSPLTAPAPVRSRPARSRPAPAPQRRPRLRVVDEVAPRRSPRRGRLVVVVAAVAAVVSLFALAAFHAMLVSGQVALDELGSRVADEQGRYESLRLEVASLESPERVVAVAQEQLGMVPPEEIIWLPAPTGSPDQAPVTAGAAPEVSQVSWGAVKPYLGGTR
ncbi:MAG TPA: hypothetical protein VMN58_09240 [Acidimicrobiales bacterium]|nr:hypothetical protein [Acidimicrobiales bacterium]